MSSPPSAAMVPSGTSSFGPFPSPPSPGQLRGRIGDFPTCILERILVDNLLEDGGIPISDFVLATPILAAKAIRTVPHLFTICGVDEMGFIKDWRFWQKFLKLRGYQSKNGLWKVDNSAITEYKKCDGIADWRKDIPAAHGTDEALWNGDIDYWEELQKLGSQ
ncbi:hypothetical protein E8E11_008653 [Didymella keratinophila]|nr:hypothetical protein E8E11_008653 [Didymella keratinophila]